MYELPIRRLRIYDTPKVTSHFNSLDTDALASRFGAPVSRTFLDAYLSRIFDDGALVYGAFPDSCLRGVGELRTVPDRQNQVAELAFTVETAWQDRGIGDALLSRIIAAARNRGFREVHMMCLATNQRMRRLASKHKADLKLVTGQVEATLTPPWPTPFSLVEEISGEYHALARAILTWPRIEVRGGR
ncbi:MULTISPECIES: GNAT family N-acetyltransferase [Ruegeria]|jgi:L-amino acid N-acyltransferase YncA|uniref:GNAT family N-acetyltransferase n=1 Tax=Ruegeria TaxID=97050 RepID=UPI00147D7454|nr:MULTISPECIES: GNAT family N-acetyltransferase [Ruegeria]MBO9412904.1 GNAT family N-acetyltransferase [Ruegeria sp. R8_1]MBO9416549.1 GNAT family N-acetyltransferase [Ruegeria sp. R8_2]